MIVAGIKKAAVDTAAWRYIVKNGTDFFKSSHPVIDKYRNPGSPGYYQRRQITE
jgi:hypothetical protein